MAHPFYLVDPFAVTPRAGVAFKDDYPVWSSVGARMLSVVLVDCFEMLMGTDKNFLSLVVKIGTLDDLFEIFQCVFSGTEHLPTRTVFSKLFRANKLRRSRITCIICEIC